MKQLDLIKKDLKHRKAALGKKEQEAGRSRGTRSKGEDEKVKIKSECLAECISTARGHYPHNPE